MNVDIPKGVRAENIWHVTPINDLREHECERVECWCNPAVVDGDDPGVYVVVHNSADGREDFETGRRKPS